MTGQSQIDRDAGQTHTSSDEAIEMATEMETAEQTHDNDNNKKGAMAEDE